MSANNPKDKKTRNTLLPTFLMAGIMTVPTHAESQSLERLIVKAGSSVAAEKIIDDQTTWQNRSSESEGRLSPTTWAQATYWGQLGGPKGDY